MTTGKYMCTIGPASQKFNVLAEMTEYGMSSIRFNMSHIDYDIKEIIKFSKKIEQIYGISIPSYMDLKGPELRVHSSEAINLSVNDIIVIGKDIFIDNFNYNLLSIEDVLSINDGQVLLKIVEINENFIKCKAPHGGVIKNESAIYNPKINNALPFISLIDKEHIKVASELEIDYLIVSFIRNAENIHQIKKILKQLSSNMKIVAKIETREAVTNLDEIISLSDEILIGRGDLGVAFPVWELPYIQKNIAKKVKVSGKKLIIGTGFLKSMKKNILPTRAEVSDLYYAFQDGADEIMFSGETAIAKDPVRVLKMANKIHSTINK